MMQSARLEKIIALIDEANARDPKLEPCGDALRPSALLYGQRMSKVLDAFAPTASEELKIAVRGQHIQRWLRPRLDYPEGRDGYLRWRKDAGRYHATTVTDMMLQTGYDTACCDRVASLMMKTNIKTDAEAQMLEDVACLTFFRWYAGDFSQKQEIEKILAIVRKTARKMSADGRHAALALDLPASVKNAIAAGNSIDTASACSKGSPHPR